MIPPLGWGACPVSQPKSPDAGNAGELHRIIFSLSTAFHVHMPSVINHGIYDTQKQPLSA